jgi:hypothetical protein
MAVMLVALLAVAGGAEAGWLKGRWFKSGDGLPTPVSLTGMERQENHKPGKRARHPSAYERKGWGALWQQSLSYRDLHFGHSLRER